MQSNAGDDVTSKGREGRSKLNSWLHACLAAEQVILGAKLDGSDIKHVADLWDEVINPACLRFQEETGKPAHLLREAITVGFERRVKKFHRWNAWEQLWWNKLPNIEDKGVRGMLLPHCRCLPLTGCIPQIFSTRPALKPMIRKLQN